MAPRRYLNFDLRLDQEGEGQYQALVTGSPLGETPSVRFRLPFDATTLENLLLKLDPGRSGTRRVGGSPQQQAAMDFGGPLFDAVFSEELLLTWTRSQDLAREQGDGLRLRLRLSDAPAIAGLPWELLYDERTNSFLAQSERTPIVRFMDLPQVPRPISVDGPLRLLVVISSPTDLDELDVEAEWARIKEALGAKERDRLVVVDRLPEATLPALGDWLRAHETHVIHFVGHGDFDKGLREGVIYFQDDRGRSKAVTSSVLGPFLRDHDPLRMVVLNACRSARADMTDPYGGMAQGLVQQDSTAVVAMQFPISDRAAVAFTGAFYGALVDGLPVDQAASSARKALLADFRDEWATPVLFMRSPDGDIFTDLHATEGAPPRDADPTPGPTPPVPPTPEPPGPVPPGPVPPGPVPRPGPSLPQRVLAWISGHRALVAIAAGTVLTLVIGGIVVLVWQANRDQGGSGFDEVFPPSSTPLRDSQLLVAAGDGIRRQHIWLVDAADPGASVQLTHADTREAAPVLSPDRTTMIFQRARPGTDAGVELIVARAIDGLGQRPLFEAGTPADCAFEALRPGWFPGADRLVVPCVDAARNPHLLLVDTNGEVTGRLDPPAELGLGSLGEPSVSVDGTTVLLWGSPEPDADGGSLFAVDVATQTWTEMLHGDGDVYSDPVFSPDGQTIAYRQSVDGNFEVFVARPDGVALNDTRVTDAAGKDQDPVFSAPDGAHLVFGHVDPGDDGARQSLRWVSLADGSAPQPLDFPGLPQFQSVPAWARR